MQSKQSYMSFESYNIIKTIVSRADLSITSGDPIPEGLSWVERAVTTL